MDVFGCKEDVTAFRTKLKSNIAVELTDVWDEGWSSSFDVAQPWSIEGSGYKNHKKKDAHRRRVL